MTEIMREKEFYRERIIEMAGKIEDLKFLTRLYYLLKEYLREEKPE